MDISDDTLFKSFIINRGIRERTIKRYKRQLELYCTFINKKPTELINEAENEEDQGLRMRNRSIKKYLLDFKQFLENKNYSSHTIVNTITIVRSFYTEFDVILPKMHLKQKHKNESIEDIPNKEDIRKALKYANPKYNAIILTMSSAGFGSAEIRSLKYTDLLRSLKEYINIPKNSMLPVDELIKLVEEKQKEFELIFPMWTLSRVKTGTPIITFSTPESLIAILEYLKIDPPASLESPLFRSNKIKDKEISDGGLDKYFHMLNNKCGFGKPNLQSKFRSHAVGRKWFATTLNDVGIPQITIDFFLGHSLGAVTGAYIKPNVETLKDQYLKCIESLSIQDVEVKTIESLEYKELKEQYYHDSKAKEEEIKNLKAEKDEEMAEMRRELNLVKDLLIDKGVRKELDKR
jgi:integrase